AEMIENLLDASRLEAGVLAVNAIDLMVPSLVTRLIERFSTQTDNHTFCVDFPQDFPVIMGDDKRLTQVIYNLISNAIKYSPSGGEICIEGEIRAEEVVICVRDEGPGIGTGDIPHIFERFYRAESAQRNTNGAGLGLYLTRAVVESHNGTIWADAHYKDGARICFTLPR
ncbi:MAG: ATP-binding protein, partial [Chloroflexota bacterium]